MHESSTGDYERLCEIGQEILGATRLTRWRRTGRAGGPFAGVEGVDRQERTYERYTGVYERSGKKFWAQHGRRGGGRRPPASRRGPGTGRAGGPSAADGGVDRKERMYERWTRVHESSREIGQEIFGASRQTGGCGQLAAGPAAAVAAGVDWGLTVNEHNRAKGVLARRMRGDDELAARESYKIICYSSEDTCGKRLQANEKSVRWRRISSRFAGLLAFSSSSISSS